MLEPEAKSDFVAPEVEPAAAMMRVVDEKSTISAAEPAHSSHQPLQLMHSPTHHIGPFHHPTTVGPSQHTEVRHRENLGACISFRDSVGLKFLMKLLFWTQILLQESLLFSTLSDQRFVV